MSDRAMGQCEHYNTHHIHGGLPGPLITHVRPESALAMAVSGRKTLTADSNPPPLTHRAGDL